jgi:hypothetical protein
MATVGQLIDLTRNNRNGIFNRSCSVRLRTAFPLNEAKKKEK